MLRPQSIWSKSVIVVDKKTIGQTRIHFIKGKISKRYKLRLVCTCIFLIEYYCVSVAKKEHLESQTKLIEQKKNV